MDKENAHGCLFGIVLVLLFCFLLTLNSIDEHLVALVNAIREH